MILLYMFEQMLYNSMIYVLATQITISWGSDRNEVAVDYLQDGDIQSAASKVKDQNLLLFVFSHGISVESSGDRSSSWLIQDFNAVKAC